MDIAKPYLLFLGDVHDQLAAKTAQGIVDWRRDWCVGQLRLEGCKADTGLKDVSIAEGAKAGAKTLVVGVVNAGGVLPAHWIDTIVQAIEAGMDVATGLHVKLADNPKIAAAARKHGRKLHDVRHPTQTFPTGKGNLRSGKRLLMVGTDCSVGKKYTALAMERGMRERGFDADFRATGQTGIFISGRGVAVDAVVADFIAGAAEWLTPAADPFHWDVVEGQGSLFHPSFAGVTLGLLHGAQPDAFIVCHEPTRRTMRGVQTALPSIGEVIEMTTSLGRLTNPAITCVGLAINTEHLSEDAAFTCLDRLSREYELPATDPVRFGVEPLVDAIAELYGEPEPMPEPVPEPKKAKAARKAK
ncbi:N-acetyltransferase DgcN [Phreatobacter sp.]|uniref:N-acetyltransferase DgcN n=1 Tax=Phreatobacter sp. TaxID=1966341 RepID=UPI003F6FC880